MMVVVDLPEGMISAIAKLVTDKTLAYEDLGDFVASAVRNYSIYKERVLGVLVA